jgi:hypothetical protein
LNEKAQKFSISVDQVQFINQELGLGLNSAQVLLAAQACAAITSEYDFINNVADLKTPTKRKHSRPKSNKHNAWTYQCELRESKSGSLAGLTFEIKDSINYDDLSVKATISRDSQRQALKRIESLKTKEYFDLNRKEKNLYRKAKSLIRRLKLY